MISVYTAVYSVLYIVAYALYETHVKMTSPRRADPCSLNGNEYVTIVQSLHCNVSIMARRFICRLQYLYGPNPD